MGYRKVLRAGRVHHTLRPHPGHLTIRNASGASAHRTSAYHPDHAQPPRRGDESLSPPARPQPGRLVSVGTRRARRARLLDRPIFLSIGYAACHWCHVMERESFEHEPTARYLNDHFVSIKVDREERPDLDQVYMAAVQSMTGGGGWPMSVFLTPDGRPFYGGTYFPDEPRHGMPSFRQVLEGVERAWREGRAEVEAAGGRLVQGLVEQARLEAGADDPTTELLDARDGRHRGLVRLRPTAAGAGRRSSRSR